MVYIRKTRDDYDIEMYTACGWEIVDCRSTITEAKVSKREYQQNQPEYQYRIVKRRVKL